MLVMISLVGETASLSFVVREPRLETASWQGRGRGEGERARTDDWRERGLAGEIVRGGWQR